jgi:hypothetical protein
MTQGWIFILCLFGFLLGSLLNLDNANMRIEITKARSAGSSNSNQLFFPAEKNNIQILPQRFEYQLLNKDQIRIGDILIDANQIDFQVIPGKSDQLKLRFRWPAGLLQSGEIAIQDNSGKGIWFQKFKKEQVQFIEGTEAQPSFRTSLATYETVTEVPSLLKLIRSSPFFRFCVHREEPLTRIYLCSKDLYLQKVKNEMTITARDRSRPESYVEINGQMVSSQGMVILNDPTQFVAMRTLMLSGSSLELDTRMKNVRFKDVLVSDNKKEILVRAKGAEPVNPRSVEHLPGDEADEWQTHLDRERPFTYLKGEGDLPLRQEFLINGPLRPDNVKVEVVSTVSDLVSNSDYALLLKPAEGLTLKPSDSRSKLETIKDPSGATYKWTLTNLKKGESNRRYIKVISDSQEFVAAYEIERQTPAQLSLHLMYPLWVQARLNYSLTNRYDLFAGIDQQLKKDSDGNALTLLTAGARSQILSGERGKETSYLGGGYIQSFQMLSKSLYLIGASLDIELKSPAAFSEIFPWTYVSLRLPLFGTDSEYKLKLLSYELQAEWRHPVTRNFYWDTGLRLQSFQYDSGLGSLNSNKASVFGGVGWIF